MKINKLLITFAITISFFILFLQNSSANASKWHVGVPPTISNHSWISEFKQLKKDQKYGNEYYVRYEAMFPSRDIGFAPMSLFYDKNKKLVTTGSATSNSVPFPFYKRISKNKYKIITGIDHNNKRNLKHDLKTMNGKYGGYTVVKVHNSNKISVWYHYKDLNGKLKTQYGGLFHKDKKTGSLN